MTPMLTKIALFWLVVRVGVWLLRRRPTSRLSLIAFAWQGPFPRDGELRSQFLVRKARFALGWLGQIPFVAAIFILVAWLMPSVAKSETLILVASFAMTIGAGMAVLGAAMAMLASLKASLIGPNPAYQYVVESEAVEDDEPEQEAGA